MLEPQTTPAETASAVPDRPTFRQGILTRLRRWVYGVGGGFVGLYALLIVVLMANETALVYPAPTFDSARWPSTPDDVEEMEVLLENGWRVHGWYLVRPGADRVVLFCHGNAEDVPGTLRGIGRRLSEQLHANVLIFDYPGYGKSEGTPFEDECIESGNVALTWLCLRENLLPSDIIVYGRSLGGGIAVALVQRHGARALILDRTFDAITNPGAARYPWAPVQLLMRNRYPSSERIAECTAPVFVSHFEQDDVIPLWSARRLFEAATNASQREFLAMPGGDHLAPLPDTYWVQLREFLRRVESTAGQSELFGREQGM